MQAGDDSSVANKKRVLEPSGDAETESILKIMRLHAEHRGPREIAVQSDNLSRRYFRSRSFRSGAAPEAAAPPTPLTTVSKDYVCHMCGDKGHHIRMCPLKGDRSRRQTKKIKAASGIPRSWLKFIDPTEIPQFDSVYCLPTGQLAVLKQEHANSILSNLSAELRCSLCSEPFKDPTLVACCGTTFCRACIAARLGSACPACAQRRVLKPSDLQPNAAIATLSKQPPPAADSSFGNHQPPRTLSSDIKPLPLPVKEERSRPSPPAGPVVLADYASPFASLNLVRPK